MFMVLNKVWSMESPNNAAVCDGLCTMVPSAAVMVSTTNPWDAGFGTANIADVMNPVSLRNSGNAIKAQITPNRLNTVWASAALLAEVFATAAAMLAVIVVPIFSPSTIAHAMSNLIHPMLSIMRVRAMVALDDWSTSVSRVPKMRKIITDPKPYPCHPWINESTSGVFCRSGTDSFIRESPRNSRDREEHTV